MTFARALTITGAIGAMVVAVWAGVSIIEDGQEAERKENEARAAGFMGTADRANAIKFDITDPVKWRAYRESMEARRRQAAAEQEELRRNPAERMKITNFSWSISGFGSVAIVSLTIVNDNDFAVKDIVISCDFNAPSGTLLSSASHTIFDTVKPKTKRNFKNVNIGFIHNQAARAGCSVDRGQRL